MRVPINLASRPYENLRPFYTGLFLAGVALIVLALVAVWTDRRNRVETRLLDQQISRVQAQTAELLGEQHQLDATLNTPDAIAIRQKSAFLNWLILRKSLSWTQLFMDLEKVLPEQAQITGIMPSMTKEQDAEIRLTVAATSMAPLVQFVKSLESSSQFGTPVVGQEHFPSGHGSDALISMQITTVYRPASAHNQDSPEESLQSSAGIQKQSGQSVQTGRPAGESGAAIASMLGSDARK